MSGSDVTEKDEARTNLEEGEEARQRVRRFLDRRKETLTNLTRSTEDERPVATINGDDHLLDMKASDLRILLDWADRGLNTGWLELEKPEKPEVEERQMVLVMDGVPVMVPMLIEGDGGTINGIESAMKTAKRLAGGGSGPQVVMLVPVSSIEGATVFKREVVQSSLNDVIKGRKLS